MSGYKWPNYFKIFDAGSSYVSGFVKTDSQLEDLLEIHRRMTFCVFVSKNRRENPSKQCRSTSRAMPTIQHLHNIDCGHLRICEYAGTKKHNNNVTIKSEEPLGARELASVKKSQLTTQRKYKSKKVCCPARIIIKYVTMFTDYPVTDSMTRAEIRNLIKELKDHLSRSDICINRESQIYVKLPLIEAHNHKLSERQLTKGSLHPRITKKMYELITSGITDYRKIKQLLDVFVYNDLLNTLKSVPKEYDSKYFPSSETVRRRAYYIYKKLVREGKITDSAGLLHQLKKRKKLKSNSKTKLIPITFEIDEDDNFNLDEPKNKVQVLDGHKLDDESYETKDKVVIIVDSKEERSSKRDLDVKEPIVVRKLCVTGLDCNTTSEELDDYFNQWGIIEEALVIRDQITNKSKRIGYVTFNCSSTVDKVQNCRPHQIDGKFIDTRRMVSNNADKDFNSPEYKHTKVSILGLSENIKISDIQSYFSNYGNVISTKFMTVNNYSKQLNIVIEFDDHDPVDKMFLSNCHAINGSSVQIAKHFESDYIKQENTELHTKDYIGDAISTEHEDLQDITDDEENGLQENDLDLSEQFSEESVNFTPLSPQCIILESFYGGTQKTLVDMLKYDQYLQENCPTAIFSLPNSNWQCRARSSALYFAQTVPFLPSLKKLFVSSTLNLCELIGLRSDLSKLYKILYFHDHQLTYPIYDKVERDIQFGYNQILSCLAADVVVFNSRYTLQSFVQEIPKFLSLLPDSRLDSKHICFEIKKKAEVIYCPIESRPFCDDIIDSNQPLHILWYDHWLKEKNSLTFFNVIRELVVEKCNFYISVIGNSYCNTPSVFKIAKERFRDYIIYWGQIESEKQHRRILSEADVIVSTSQQDFSATPVLEAIDAGCYALCPNRLVYPEFLPKNYLYNTHQQLKKQLSKWCHSPHLVRNKKVNINIHAFTWDVLKLDYYQLFDV